VDGKRYLIVTADDFGIGPATSQGILMLAAAGQVTSSVLLVTSPYAEEAVRAWERAGKPMELGWHPCLTLDRPLTPARQVPSLVDAEGRFWPLGRFLRRVALGRIRAAEVEAELHAQSNRFCDLIGGPPTNVNSHHHVQIFAPVGESLRKVLARCQPAPYVRRIQEPWTTLAWVPGARGKRLFLSSLGKREARRQAQAGFPGNEWLIGVTDPPYVADPNYLVRWLRRVPGRVVELTCHPGHWDGTLLDRDCTPGDGQLHRREHEWLRLHHASFRDACQRAGFTLVTPSDLLKLQNYAPAHAA
jgi:predicted glycoside hydrolase/deacetylase ChbG (UPF0249 family)